MKKLTAKPSDTVSVEDLEKINNKIIVCRIKERFGIYVLLKVHDYQYVWARLGDLGRYLSSHSNIKDAVEYMESYRDSEIFLFDSLDEDEFIKWVIEELKKDLERTDEEVYEDWD